MHGKAQREPARHSVVPDCKLEPLHSTCQGFHAVRLAVSPNAQMYGLGKNSPTVLSRFWTKVHQIRQACRGLPVDWQVFRLLISCSVAEIYSVQIQSRSQKSVFCSQPVGGGGNARWSSDLILQIAVISEYVSKFGWDSFSDLRD